MAKPTLDDPHAQLEAQKYDNPIPSRVCILDLLDNAPAPMTRSELSQALGLEDEDAWEALRRRLRAMERDGQLISNRKGAYCTVDKLQLLRGRVLGHREGYGFFVPADGSSDLYLTPRQMRKVFHGDEVLVRPGPEDYRGRKEATIIEVLEHNTRQLVGRLIVDKGFYLVRPDNARIAQDILLEPDHQVEAKPGQIVLVDITRQPSRSGPPVGVIAEVLGDHLAAGLETDVAIRSHGIPFEWPDAVVEQANRFAKEVEQRDTINRIDLRSLPFVTIDGEDARDFDDAVYCERKRSGGWRLYVAIADVSHYVLPHSPLDDEAKKRGTSVYFPERVVPMLPEALSNGLCSLNPHVDRLCMVCEMTVSATGKVSGYHFYEATIHSHARLTYTQVGRAVETAGKKNSGTRKNLHHVLPQIDQLHELYGALRSAREQRGAIDFDTQETRILFDEQRKIKNIVPLERNVAHKMIEECMLAANVSAAKFLEQHHLPALYRVHARPKPEKLAALRDFLKELGIHLSGGEHVSPQIFQAVLSDIADRPDAHIIQTVMLRSMNQAVYQSDNQGHFGLAYDAYSHFTSPIRRYPDLLVHRAIRSVIRSKQKTRKVKRHPKASLLTAGEIYPYSDADMLTLGEHCSTTERRADEATRDVLSWLKCEYMQEHVGDVFDGIISAVVPFGLFVELNDIFVEGLVHVTSLPKDYYVHDAAHHRMVGERSHAIFGLGDSLSVQVAAVNLDERKIDFELHGHNQKRKRTKVSTAAKALADEYHERDKKKKSKKKKNTKSKREIKRKNSSKKSLLSH